MKILLDTHVFLWYISGDSRLSADLRDRIRDPENEVSLSVVSIWEAIIKNQIGKLPLPGPPGVYLSKQRERHGFASLVLNEESIHELVDLPAIHRDPFDRILICQARHHNMALATVDQTIALYDVPVLNGES